MLGAFRLLLALDVMAFHLAHHGLGGFDVRIFFVVSGYLMTASMATNYAGPGGRWRFAASRFLRIYPAYWLALLMVVPLIRMGLWPQALPVSPGELLQQVTLAWVGPLPGGHHMWPMAWTLSVEVAAYVAIGLGATATLRRSLACLAFALVATAVLGGASYDLRCTSLLAASLPFSLGAAAYWLRGHLRWAHGVFGGLGMVGCYAATIATGIDPDGMPMHLACVFAAMLVGWLAPMRAPRWDRALGDLAYPVYLVHAQVGAVLVNHLVRGYEWPLAVISLPGVIAVSLAILWGLRWVERARRAFRSPQPVRAAFPRSVDFSLFDKP